MLRPAIGRCARPLAASLRSSITAARPRYASSSSSTNPAPSFDWEDPLASSTLFTEEERAIAETAERYCQERLLPRVLREFYSTASSFYPFSSSLHVLPGLVLVG